MTRITLQGYPGWQFAIVGGYPCYLESKVGDTEYWTPCPTPLDQEVEQAAQGESK